MAPPKNVQDWYGDRHTCQIASGAHELCHFHLYINAKNFHGSLTTVIRAQNDTSKTANITDTIFYRTLV